MNLIVGGTGFVGGHLAEYFFEQGEISKAIFRRGSQLRILDQSGVQNYEGDLLQPDSLHEPLEGVETVYILIPGTPGNEDNDDLGASAEGVRNLLEESKEHGVKTVVYLSTLDVYGFGRNEIDENAEPKPTHPYHKAKLEAERILLAFGSANPSMKVRIIRGARAVGSRDSTLVLPLLEMIEGGQVVLPKGGMEKISFSHPKDLAQALLKSAASESSTSTYLAKSFDASVAGLAETFANALGKSVRVKAEGLLSKSPLPTYTVDQIRRGLSLKSQESLSRLGYIPSYDAKKVGFEVAEWYRREPWLVRKP